MNTLRQNKIARLIQKDLGEIFQRESAAMFGGAMITVTKVYVTKDFSIARIFLSLFATGSKEDLLENIKDSAGELRFRLGRKAGKQLRVVPELHFYLDDSLDYIENIERLLDE